MGFFYPKQDYKNFKKHPYMVRANGKGNYVIDCSASNRTKGWSSMAMITSWSIPSSVDCGAPTGRTIAPEVDPELPHQARFLADAPLPGSPKRQSWKNSNPS